jgi:hypothetical protein
VSCGIEVLCTTTFDYTQNIMKKVFFFFFFNLFNFYQFVKTILVIETYRNIEILCWPCLPRQGYYCV